jgi:hypothetical protein
MYVRFVINLVKKEIWVHKTRLTYDLEEKERDYNFVKKKQLLTAFQIINQVISRFNFFGQYIFAIYLDILFI